MTTRKSVFLSHQKEDRRDVQRLAEQLKEDGYDVAFDEWDVKVGDSITGKIQAALQKADYLALWWTKNAAASQWVQQEWQSQHSREIKENRTIILPLLAEPCDLPGLLHQRRYADFTQGFDVGYRELKQALTDPDSPDGSVPAIEPSPWLNAIRRSTLWQLCDETAGEALGADYIDELRRCVEGVVTDCWSRHQQACQAMPQDPWRHDGTALRALRAVEKLLSVSKPAVVATATEYALVMLAPFVYEGVTAIVQLRMLERAKPFEIDHQRSQSDVDGALQRIHDGSRKWVLKARQVATRSDADAILAWLMWRTILREPDTWVAEPKGWLPQEFPSLADCAPASRMIRDGLSQQRLLRLAECLHAGPKGLARRIRTEAFQRGDDRQPYRGFESWRLSPDARISDGIHDERINEYKLAALLAVAGAMSLDPRHLARQDILIDHIGLVEPVSPEDAKHVLDLATWIHEEGTLSLSATCEHPALDLALLEEIDRVDELMRFLIPAFAPETPLHALRGLPRHFSANRLEIATRDGIRLFERPHVRFELAHDELREMLMGERLYGDPLLAIRELYQNALDACRYRQARTEYLHKTGEEIPAYAGRIEFRQRLADDGRTYVECKDNGIGMDIYQLKECFAKAGRRFTETSEYLQERALWDSLDEPVRHFANSQFGIGVLSYFMLADEIEIETCRMGVHGTYGKQLKASFCGSGGLFRVRQLGDSRSFGTTVRLYINDVDDVFPIRDQGQTYSSMFGARSITAQPVHKTICDVLPGLLWVAEFDTTADDGAQTLILEPGELNTAKRIYWPTRHPDIWWAFLDEQQPMIAFTGSVPAGAALADGLKVEKMPDKGLRPYLLVNFRAEHRPTLTVDRNRLLKCDTEWPVEQIMASEHADGQTPDWTNLGSCPDELLNFVWLAKVATEDPVLATRILSDLLQTHPVVPFGPGGEGSVDLRLCGLSALDGVLLSYIELIKTSEAIPWGPPMGVVAKQFLQKAGDGNAKRLFAARLKLMQQYGAVGDEIEQLFGAELDRADIQYEEPHDAYFVAHPLVAANSDNAMLGAGALDLFDPPLVVTVGTVAHVAADLRLPMQDVYKSLSRLACYGFSAEPCRPDRAAHIPDADEGQRLGRLDAALRRGNSVNALARVALIYDDEPDALLDLRNGYSAEPLDIDVDSTKRLLERWNRELDPVFAKLEQAGANLTEQFGAVFSLPGDCVASGPFARLWVLMTMLNTGGTVAQIIEAGTEVLGVIEPPDGLMAPEVQDHEIPLGDRPLLSALLERRSYQLMSSTDLMQKTMSLAGMDCQEMLNYMDEMADELLRFTPADVESVAESGSSTAEQVRDAVLALQWLGLTLED